MRFEIQSQTDRTASGAAYVHYKAWQETYRGLMPDEFLDSHTYEKCRRYADTYQNKFVAVVNGQAAGFAAFLPERRDFCSAESAGEIVALYVLKKYQKAGIGKALMESCLNKIEKREVVLFVLKGNENAIGFYRRIGFRPTGREMIQQVAGGEITELEMLLKR
ncbi:GNAT family N-acetyltransferase [Ruminococcus sp. Marseille-P6503]|uniref:GNAT family N-acetyltransferase n=1 Tax=Ruminococcus sp. Marseille-P6503 TaxID=2364796 RepID=UPI000F533255|nr:GNAT family N-acetyltransferase [Ruminococcus sp. Marseille-P6503]